MDRETLNSRIPQAEATPNLLTEQDPTEATLIAQVKQGDQKAFEELMRRHEKSIANHFYAQFRWIRADRRQGLVEECTQDTFTEAYWSINTYKYHPGKPFIAWLQGIAHYIYCKACIKHKKEHKVNIIPFRDLPEHWDFEGKDVLGHVLNHDLFLREFQVISLVEQEAILLHFYQGQTFQAIGERQGRTPKAVKQAIYRFRKKLRQASGDQKMLKGPTRADEIKRPQSAQSEPDNQT